MESNKKFEMLREIVTKRVDELYPQGDSDGENWLFAISHASIDPIIIALEEYEKLNSSNQ